MEQTVFTPQERFESLKAGILAGTLAGAVFGLLMVINQFLFFPGLPERWIAPILVNADVPALLAMGRSVLIATISGFLFGVAYRYVIRSDTNPQLQSGAVLAFSLVRGLAQIDTGVGITDTTLPFVLIAIESGLMFSCDRIVLNQALHRGWIKPFANPLPTTSEVR